MSLGYVKGKYWVADDRFARYAKWDAYRELFTPLREQNLSIDVRFTYITHTYEAEIVAFEQRPWGYLRTPKTLATDPNPLAAVSKAIRKLHEPGPLLRALCLEIEVQLLAETAAENRRWKTQLEQLDAQLDTLHGLVRSYPLDDDWHGDLPYGQARQ